MAAMPLLLSRPLRTSKIGTAPHRERVNADQAERAALAAAYSLPAIHRLAGDFLLRREAGAIFAATLHLQAMITQECVVTLEPFDAALDERAALRFIPAAAIAEAADLAALDENALEAPDELPYAGDSIDLGAALAEQLALALDPYPRRPGAELPAVADTGAPHPFANLARRKS